MSKVLVYDRGGLYVHIALSLAKKFDDVVYFSEWRNGGFPTCKPDLIGRGFDKIRRASNFFEELDGTDLVVFPDVGDPDLQQHIREQKIPVFGTGDLELLEMDKIVFEHWLDEVGLPKPKTFITTGLDELEELLKEKTELYLKGNYRGDFETFRHIKWELTEQWFNDLKHNVGPFGRDVRVIAQEAVEGVEIGVDSFICDGKFPGIIQWGFECKDAGYLGKVDLYEKLPKPLKTVNDALATFATTSRGAFSTEVRIGKDLVPYFIDPTTRFALPPSGGMCEWYENWADVIDSIARGVVISPKPKKKYLAEICLLPLNKTLFKAIRWPESMNRRVKLLYWYKEDGVNYSIPISDGFVGSAIGLGNTMDEALEEAEKTARSVEGYGIEWSESVSDQLREVVKECEKIGIKF